MLGILLICCMKSSMSFTSMIDVTKQPCAKSMLDEVSYIDAIFIEYEIADQVQHTVSYDEREAVFSAMIWPLETLTGDLDMAGYEDVNKENRP